jgi:hypothetical protein
MATIRKRKRKDGTCGYTAQARVMRDGVQVYQESQAGDRRLANAWQDPARWMAWRCSGLRADRSERVEQARGE